MFQLLYPLVRAIQPFLVPICFAIAWIFILTVSWSIYRAISATFASAKRLHQIPCSHCVFFTNDYRLKCPVRPTVALTEEAIGCLDYRQKQAMR